MGRPLTRLLLALCVALAGVAAPLPPRLAGVAAAAPYAVEALAVLPGAHGTHTLEINDAGQVTGTGSYHAFLSDHGRVTDLGTLGHAYSDAGGLNDAGLVSGWAWNTANGEGTRGFVYWDGAMRPIDLTRAFGINAAGAVAGYVGGWPTRQAAVWADGAATLLETPRPTSFWTSAAWALNDRGQVVGTANGSAALWDHGALALLGSGSANDVNNVGQVLVNAGGERAALWQGGVRTELGTLGGATSYGFDLNERGQVVGTARSATALRKRAFLWADGAMRDLNDLIPVGSGWELEVAMGINERGQIVGTGNSGGADTVFLLTPADFVPPPNPGPSPTPSPSASPAPSTPPASPSPSAPSASPSPPRPGPVPTLTVVSLPVEGGAVAVVRAGDRATLTATPAAGQLFLGWRIDAGVTGTWANPLVLTLAADTTIVADFAPRPVFGDATTGDTGAAEAIAQLAARGIILGCDPAVGRFCPADPTLRAQMAALIVRAMGWGGERVGTPFADRDGVDDELWRAVGILAAHGVARGHGDGTYGTTSPVLNAQVIAFIARAMVDRGHWQFQPDDGTIYPNIPGGSGHRQDLVTFVHYAGAVRGADGTTGDFAGWDRPATRAWFAVALWQALDTTFGR